MKDLLTSEMTVKFTSNLYVGPVDIFFICYPAIVPPMDVRHEACFVTTPYDLFCPVLKSYYHVEQMLCIMIARENVPTLPDKQKNAKHVGANCFR